MHGKLYNSIHRSDTLHARKFIWVCPRERFLTPPPSNQFVHDFIKLLLINFYYLRVRFRKFLGRAPRLGQTIRGPSAAARTDHKGVERGG